MHFPALQADLLGALTQLYLCSYKKQEHIILYASNSKKNMIKVTKKVYMKDFCLQQ